MLIHNQDGDQNYNVSGPIDLMYAEQKYKNIWMGWNVYKLGNGRKYLLGTYDEEADAKQLVKEIGILASKGINEYWMPEPVGIYERGIS